MPLDAGLVQVGHDIHAEPGFRCDGEMRLNNADVRGSVKLRGAHLNCPDGRALLAVNLTVGSAVSCCEGFTATGRINLSFATVTRQVCFERARLVNRAGPALSLRHLRTNELVLRPAGRIEGRLAVTRSLTRM
ncbi:hypothetical protein [Micromonospora zhanjiangensis]|uniref:Protein CcmA, bactofilin family n=1 Tax=Micromonospora zhanjiangensis TaxID=1522057 RepID=A0ABV8KMY9_9ACTN